MDFASIPSDDFALGNEDGGSFSHSNNDSSVRKRLLGNSDDGDYGGGGYEDEYHDDDLHPEVMMGGDDESTCLSKSQSLVIDFSNVLKSFIGSNFLGVPYAFRQAGMVGGILGIILIAGITNHCCQLLVKVKNSMDRKEELVGYGDVGRRLWGKFGLVLIDAFLVFTQTGFCIGYTIFMAKNIKTFFPDSVPQKYLIACAIPTIAILPFIWVKNIKKLGWTSLIADVLLLVGIVLTLSSFRFERASYGPSNHWALFNFSGIAVFFGLITSSYEGIGLVIPVETTMNHRGKRYSYMLHATIFIVTLILGGFGLMGYLSYGTSTDAVITLNLPKHSVITYIVKACLVVAIFFTYPLQMFPVTEIFETFLFREQLPTASPYFSLKRNALRTVVAMFVGVVAYFVPFFGLISGLVGALGSSCLAFLIPVCFHTWLFRGQLPWYVSMKNAAVFLFGLAVMVIGTTFAVKDIVNAIIHGPNGG